MSAGCGRNSSDNAYVHYSGSTLDVEGESYAREKIDFKPGPGRVLVTPKEGEREAAVALLARYGLPLIGTTPNGVLVATVPEGFEFQWARALSRAAPVEFTNTDEANAPVAVVDESAPAVAVAAGVPVPDGGPSAAVVSALTHRMYEKIEADGGMPLTLTATGATRGVHVKLADVAVASCEQRPRAKPGEFECGVRLKVRSCFDNCDPSEEEALDDAKRIRVRWDPSGEWMLD